MAMVPTTNLSSTEASLDELLVGEGGRADEASLSKVSFSQKVKVKKTNLNIVQKVKVKKTDFSKVNIVLKAFQK